MRSLIQFLAESKGADIKDRKWARFFGDDYGKDVSLKKVQWRTKKFLKDFKDDISEKSFDFLNKLAVLKQEDYDARSKFQANFYKEKEYYFDYSIEVANISNAIVNKLSSKVVSKEFDLTLQKAIGLNSPSAKGEESYYDCSANGFGTTTHLIISFYSSDKEEFFKVFNYVADILNEIGEEILSYEDNYKDRDAIRQRLRRNKGE